MDALLRCGRLLSGAARRHREGRAAQSAAALAFALLFALVPLVVLARQLMALFPDMLQFGAPLQAYLTGALLPDATGSSIIRHTGRFVAKARRLSSAELLLLLVSAWIWVRTADHAMNAMWSRVTARKLRRTLMLYLTMPVIAPLALGLAAALSVYIVTASLGTVDEPAWFKYMVVRMAAAAVTIAFLFWLYRLLPRTTVSATSALTGALVAGVLLMLLQRALSLYVAEFHAYAHVYGALSTLPVFLLWLYLLWSTVLYGAAVVAEMQENGVRR
ncbi:YhjD/YihY/BrkB family envelope integrity protein [Methyloversatilis thermotolerans]|uniref:YhjD/YihY/BrkB family envelope integrity protein n=1 Tax=Methyloversatilis thermotolerans TaxID=1346290 RepID=UPI00036CE3EC|nr:YhjD/YihY/BrkB family envelope integrity protein [Methyloversatilis thermotolerans]